MGAYPNTNRGISNFTFKEEQTASLAFPGKNYLFSADVLIDKLLFLSSITPGNHKARNRCYDTFAHGIPVYTMRENNYLNAFLLRKENAIFMFMILSFSSDGISLLNNALFCIYFDSFIFSCKKAAIIAS